MHLRPIEHQRQRILTSQQLAEFYGTDTTHIKQNFNNNKDRYVEGKHYFYLEGETLKQFKDEVENFDLVEKRAPSLYLWTEKGALMHAKSLNTDKAWEQYEELVDDYYRRGDQLLNRQDEMLALAEKLTDLEKRLHSLPPGLSAAQVDLADMATHRIYQMLTQNLSHLSIFYDRKKITDEHYQEVLDTIKGLVEPMENLYRVIQQELDLETDLTYILFDYRGILETLNPEYKLMTGPKPRIELISRPSEEPEHE